MISHVVIVKELKRTPLNTDIIYFNADRERIIDYDLLSRFSISSAQKHLPYRVLREENPR